MTVRLCHKVVALLPRAARLTSPLQRCTYAVSSLLIAHCDYNQSPVTAGNSRAAALINFYHNAACSNHVGRIPDYFDVKTLR